MLNGGGGWIRTNNYCFRRTYSNEADLDFHTLLGYKIAFAACLSVVIPKNGLTVDFSTFNCHKALDCSGLVQNDY